MYLMMVATEYDEYSLVFYDDASLKKQLDNIQNESEQLNDKLVFVKGW